MIQLQTNLSGESESSPIFVDATSITWNSDRKVENIYGLGGQPRGRGFGNVTYEASITLPYATQVSLRDKSSDGTLMGLGEFNLIVSFLNDLAQNVTKETVTLSECFLSQSGMQSSQDDTSITKEFDLHPYRIFNPTVANNKKMGWGHELYAG
jgi:hypothetical protein